MKSLWLLCGLVVTMLTTASAQDNGDQLIGLWEPSNGKARVKVEKIGSKYYGKIVWLREPNDPQTKQPKVDKNNPDESMRSVPLKGYRQGRRIKTRVFFHDRSLTKHICFVFY